MSTPDDAGPRLDAYAHELLEAFRADEALPQDVSDRVRARLEDGGVLPGAATSNADPRGRWWIPAAGIVLAAAAALLMWQGGWVSATPEHSSDAVQARDQANAQAHGAGVSTERPARRDRGSGHFGQPRPPTDEPPSAGDEASAGHEASAGDEATRAPAFEDATPAEPAPSITRAPSRRPTTPARARDANPTPPQNEPDPPTSSSLSEETKALAKAQAAVSAGRYEEALRTLAKSERRFPAGVLGEERAALRAIALCEADDKRAKSAAAAFASAHPSSALRARVRNACANR